MSDWKVTPIKMAISYKDESPIFGANTMFVSVRDNAGGWYIELENTDGEKIEIDFDQFKIASNVAEKLMSQEPLEREK